MAQQHDGTRRAAALGSKLTKIDFPSVRAEFGPTNDAAAGAVHAVGEPLRRRSLAAEIQYLAAAALLFTPHRTWIVQLAQAFQMLRHTLFHDFDTVRLIERLQRLG